MSESATVAALSSHARAFLVAPAGCGKTEVIVNAAAQASSKPQLILTHTHAGVHALRSRFRKKNLSTKNLHIETIAGWALRYAENFPRTSRYLQPLDGEHNWEAAYEAAARVIGSRVGSSVLRNTYEGVFVDEYQDCTIEQHALVLALAANIKCRILGDPLQAIFGFGKSRLVDWSREIPAMFEQIDFAPFPHRWAKTNPALGELLLSMRQELIAGNEITFRKPIEWLCDDGNPMAKAIACFRLANQNSVVALDRFDTQCHDVARKLKGTYTSMDEVFGSDLRKTALLLDRSTDGDFASAIIDFAGRCLTKAAPELKSIRDAFGSGRRPRSRKYPDIAETLHRASQTKKATDVAAVLELIRAIDGAVLFRRELWRDMRSVLRTKAQDETTTYFDGAVAARRRISILGRKNESRVISRTHLVKGLEFEHVVILNVEQLTAKELYVALTRGAKSVTVLAKKPSITPRA